jgi:murein DD-endopeptidase MepM/ murein hydrolase activator NlpD
MPTERHFRVTSFFDHNTPFLARNGSVTAFWGITEAALSYDGHTGWDYAMMPPDAVLAAADGTVVFSGNSDDGCATPARGVIIDHGNGYRTLYWHLHERHVATGEQVTTGQQIGVAGATGCAFGPHLHFQVQYLGRDVDPYGWCGEGQGPWAANPAGQESVWLWSDMIPPCGPPPPDVIVVDQHLPGFAASGNWEQLPYGYGGSALYAGTISMKTTRPPWEPRPLIGTPAVATWSPTLPHAGRYRVLAYIPHIVNGLDDSREARYRVHHYDGEDDVALNIETYANSWADLGTYYFGPQSTPLVSLSVLAGDGGRGVWVDAMVWEPVE